MPEDDRSIDADDRTMDADDGALDRIRRLAAAAEHRRSEASRAADDAPTVEVGDGDLARLRRLAAESGPGTDDLPTPPAGTRRVAATSPSRPPQERRDPDTRAQVERAHDLDRLDVDSSRARRPRDVAPRDQAPWRPPVRSMRPVADDEPSPSADHRWKFATVVLGVIVVALVVWLVVRGGGDAPTPTDDTVPGASTPTSETDVGPVELEPDVGGAGG